MLNHAAMALGAGPLYTNAFMGQTLSAAERERRQTPKLSLTITRKDTIQVEESENVSLADSWSMHWDDTTQPPYSTAEGGDKISRADLLPVSKKSPLYELTRFIAENGPPPPHRRPSKLENPSRANARRRRALQFLKFKPQNSYIETNMERRRSCGELRDEGGLLSNVPEQMVPERYEQKVSSTGHKYLALQIPEQATEGGADPSLQSPSVVESRVSISFTEGINPAVSPDWHERKRSDEENSQIHSDKRRAHYLDDTDAGTILVSLDSLTPIRPSASDPPTPEPLSAVSFTESYLSNSTEQATNRSIDVPWPVANQHAFASTSSSLPLPQTLDDSNSATIQYPFQQREVEIEHPLPRRFASHTALLQRSSTITSYRGSTPDSPGPPPRSPLRPARESSHIEEIITSYNYERANPKVAPMIQDVTDTRSGIQPTRPTVVTTCTGPTTRMQQASDLRGSPSYSSTRIEREDRIMARKVRDRPLLKVRTPTPTRIIDAIVRAPTPEPRHNKLRKRPQIHIPDLRAPPLATRAPPEASSNASWKRKANSIRTPVSAVPSEGTAAGTPTTNGDITGYTPISPTTSNASAIAEARMALSPVMLVAEEIPIPRIKPSPKPTRLFLKDRKSYTPRPRSASIPRSVMKRKSRHGGQTPSRPGSPSHEYEANEAPPVPSAPPNRALPPTPPASEAGKPKRTKVINLSNNEKKLPSLPSHRILSELHENTPHVISQIRRKPVAPTENPNDKDVHSRLEALEKQNVLLSAALSAVLRTNGTVNDPLSFQNTVFQRPPMAWQQRMERRSAASHRPSDSIDGAMKLYHQTRREI